MATLTAEFLDDLCRIQVTLSDPVTNVRYQLQRSTDGGTTWVDVRGGGNMGTTGVTIVDDYEYTPNIVNMYRVLEPEFYESFNREYPSSGALQLTGAVDSYASTPDTATLDIVGDIEMLADILPDAWPPPVDQTIIAKYADSTNNRSYRFDALSDGRLRITWSTTGVNALSLTSAIPVDIIAGQRITVRATLDVDNGAGGRTARFYTSTGSNLGGPFVEIGSPQTNVGTTSIFSGTAPLEVGSRNGGTNLFTGLIFSARVRNGIGGAIVANPFFQNEAPGTLAFVDSTGKTWTVQAGASIVSHAPVPGSDWGTTDTGETWTLGGSSSGYSAWVDDGIGVITSTQPLGFIAEMTTSPIPALVDGDVRWSAIYPGSRGSLDVPVEWGIGLRSDGPNNAYISVLRFNTEADDYSVQLILRELVANVYTDLATSGSLGTWTPGVAWDVLLRVQGTSLLAKAWESTDAEPSNWTLFTTDTSLVSGDQIYAYGFKGSGAAYEQWFGPIEGCTIPSGASASVSVTPVQTEVCLKSITYPMLNQHIECVDWDQMSRDSRAGFFDIKGRHEILAIADVGSSASFTLTFVTRSEDENRAVRALLTFGGILFLQPPGDIEEDCPTGYSGIPDGYVMWDGSVQAHSVRGKPIWRWTVGFTRVAAVDLEGIVPTTITWQMLWDMIGPEGTWETVWATWPTWQQLWAAQGSIESFTGGDTL